jgi:hypothetical protein
MITMKEQQHEEESNRHAVLTGQECLRMEEEVTVTRQARLMRYNQWMGSDFETCYEK